MASVASRPNGHHWVLYRFRRKQHTLRLGVIDREIAEEIKRRIEGLIQYEKVGLPPHAELSAWLAKLKGNMRRSLVVSGLAEPRGVETLADLVNAYEARLASSNAKASTLVNMRVLFRQLTTRFGGNTDLRSITPSKAEAFRSWLFTDGHKDGGPMAPATVSNRLRRSKGLFAMAVKCGAIASNPFDGLGGSAGCEVSAPDRNVYIPWADVESLIRLTRCQETQLLLAVVRLCGLRCPSEVLPLEWPWVDLEGGVFRIRSPKTERYAGHGWRSCPIFPALRPYFVAVRPADGEGPVFPRLRRLTSAGIQGRLRTLCSKARRLPWPKPFVNMRASAEHDLIAEGRTIVEVAAWLGHSPQTALAHYNRASSELATRVASSGLKVVG
jgi:integrase